MVYGKDSHKGKYVPKHPEKYVGDVAKIVYRSGLERMFMVWCDSNQNVIKWNSEDVVLMYVSPADNRPHRYFVDFLVQIKNREGKLKTYLVEVKPFKFTKPPVVPKRKTKNFLQESVQWSVNQAKWDAAKKFCQEKGWDFMILTEKDLVRA